jgi:hypothetical protein
VKVVRRLVAVSALVAIGAAACGGGDGDGGDDPEVGIETFCDEVARFDENGDFSDEATAEAYERMEAVAPEQIRGDVEILRESLDGNVVGDERTATAGDRFTAYVERACDIDLVPAEGT